MARASTITRFRKHFGGPAGEAALTQNWKAGDFDTWAPLDKVTGNIRYSAGKIHMEAFGVSFRRADIEKLIPEAQAPEIIADETATGPSKGGRPSASWREDALIDICFKYFAGDWKPTTLAVMSPARSRTGPPITVVTTLPRARYVTGRVSVFEAIMRDREN